MSKEITEIQVQKIGPYVVKGNFKLTGVNKEDLTPVGKGTIYLCACGKSQNKPFCDGSHAK